MDENAQTGRWTRLAAHVVLGALVLLLPFVPVELAAGGCVLILALAGTAYRTERTTWLKKRDIRGGMMLVCAALVLILFVIASRWAYESYPELMRMSLPLFVVGAALGISTIADAISNLYPDLYQRTARKTEDEPNLKSVGSSLVFLFSAIVVSAAIGGWIASGEGVSLSIDMLFFVSVMGAVSATLLGSICIRTMHNFVVPLGSAMVMWLFFDVGYTTPPAHVAGVFMGALVLGYIAYRVRIADLSGLLSATLVGVLVIVFGSVWWFILVLLFFVLGGVSTKYRYAYKELRGVAQSRKGVRGYENVFSNTLPALALVVLFRALPEFQPVIFAGFLACMATATADTLASEVGETSKSPPRLITTLKPVGVGEDGGITLLGETASLLGAAATGVLAFALLALGLEGEVQCEPLVMLSVAVVCGFLGTNIDSLLGATLQRRGMLSNSGVNLVSTTLAALLGVVVYGFS